MPGGKEHGTPEPSHLRAGDTARHNRWRNLADSLGTTVPCHISGDSRRYRRRAFPKAIQFDRQQARPSPISSAIAAGVIILGMELNIHCLALTRRPNGQAAYRHGEASI